MNSDMRIWHAALGLGLVFCLLACNSSDEPSDGTHDAGVAGNVYVPPTCHQTCQDYLTGYALTNSVWFLYNQNIPGRPGGSVDVSTSCPLGGTAHITGSASGTPEGTTTVHLVFELVACRNTDEEYTLTFDGVVNMDGTFNGGGSTGSKFTAVVFASSSIEISGELSFLDDPMIEETCAVAATQEGAADSTLDGHVCQRVFSSETALDNLQGGAGPAAGSGSAGESGSAGVGGAGAAGSGGADCTCYCGWPADQVCTTGAECPPDTSVPGTSVPGVCGCPVGC